MQLELFAFFGIMAGVMLIFAEFGKHATVGIVASVFVLILGLWVAYDHLYYQVGNDLNATEIQNNTGQNILVDNTTTINGTTSLTRFEASRVVYQEFDWTFAAIRLKDFIAIVLWFAGLYGCFAFVLQKSTARG